MNGGTDILGYELQIDNGLNGNFRYLVSEEDRSFDTEFLVTNGIE